MKTPKLKELFPFEYVGGRYFRRKGIPKNVPAEIIHGDEAIKLIYSQMVKYIK